MDLQIPNIFSYANEFILLFTRMAALFSVAPVLSSPFIPLRIKLAVSGVVTLFFLPISNIDVSFVIVSFEGLREIATQFLIGISMGFILRLVFNALTIAGENIAITMGLGFAQITDPVNGVSVPIVSQFLTIFATLLFLAFDGHLALINMLFNSFVYLPIGSSLIESEVLWSIAAWATNMFAGALMVAIPAITALLIANSSLALMTRSAPQLNIFSVGFPVTILLGLVVISLTLPSIATVFEKLTISAFDQMPFSN